MPQKKQAAKQPAQPPPQVSVAETADPFGAVVQLVDKKVRNMEKRKTRLETLKTEQNEGKQLEKDQALAVSKLESVDEQLLALKDLQKGILAIQQESQKYKKKQEKAEAVQQREAQLETGRTAIAGSLRITSALTLIDETVKVELKEGKNGAPHLSEVELDALDQFYNLVDPASIREKGEDLPAAFAVASEHIQLCLERSGREVPETDGQTYKHLAKVLDDLESSGYLAKLSEATAVENVEEAEGEGPEGGADVMEEYDVIDNEDIPSTEQVQAIIDITQQQEYRRQEQARPGGGAQELPSGVSSFGAGLSHVTQAPPSSGYVATGAFPSTAVDFPGLDPGSDSTEFSFMHQSEVVQGEQRVVQGYSAPVAAGGVPSSPHEPEDVSFGTAAGKKTQVDASPSRGGDSSEEPPSLSSGGFSAPQGARGRPRDPGNRRFNNNGFGGGLRGNGPRGAYQGRRSGGRGGSGRGSSDRPYNQEGRSYQEQRQGEWSHPRGGSRGGGGGRRGAERQS